MTFVSLVLTVSYMYKVLKSSQASCMMNLWGMQANQTRSIPAWSQTLWRVILRLREMMSHFKYRAKSTHNDRDRRHLADTSQLEVIGLNRVLHSLMLSYMQNHYYCWTHSQHCFCNDVFVWPFDIRIWWYSCNCWIFLSGINNKKIFASFILNHSATPWADKA